MNGQDMERGREAFEKDFGDRQTALLIHGDRIAVADVLATRYMSCGKSSELTAGFIDLVFTRPPHPLGWHEYAGNIMDDDPYQRSQMDYLWHMYRIMSPNGSLFYNHEVSPPHRGYIHPSEWLKKSRFSIKQELIWDQRSGERNGNSIFTPTDERVFWLFKQKTRPSPSGAVPTGCPGEDANITSSTVIQARIQNGDDAMGSFFPRSIINGVLKPFLAPGRFPNRRALVMDPDGLGTTAMVALSHGANVICVDNEEGDLDATEERIRASYPNIRITRWDLTKERY